METEIIAKQVLQRRIMHVHTVGAREVDANRAQRILAARILLERIVGRVLGIPINLRRLQFAMRRIEDANVILGQIIGLVLHSWNEVLAYDRSRHRPGLKLISMILLSISGDGRSGLPTTPVCRETATSCSIASIRAAGMLQTT